MTLTRLNATVAGGVGVWALWLFLIGPSWTHALLALAPLVILPTGLRLAQYAVPGPGIDVLDSFEFWRVVSSMSLLVSLSIEPGRIAGLFAVPWLLYTAAVATVGALRLLSRRALSDTGIASDFGQMFLVVGGSWLLLSRLGVAALGFSPTIVRLTAVHFHYAGFALPIIAAIASRRWATAGVWLERAVVVGIPITALGITLEGVIEFPAAMFMAAVGLVVAFAVGGLAAERRDIPLGVASLALASGMLLAMAWAITQQWQIAGLPIGRMVRTHGTLNAIGFGFLGLWAINRFVREEPDYGAGPVESLIRFGRPRPAHLAKLFDCAPKKLSFDRDELELDPSATRASWSMHLGRGAAVFEEAVHALNEWAGHHGAGFSLHPEQASIDVGSTLAIGIPYGPIHATATSMIVDVVDSPGRYGFAYATMPHHFQRGIEWFIVSHGDETDEVTLNVDAVFHPGVVLVRVGKPIVGRIQNSALHRYMEAIKTRANQSSS